MEKTPDRTDNQPTRREILKKAGKFVIPTIITFQISSLSVAASLGLPGVGNPYHK